MNTIEESLMLGVSRSKDGWDVAPLWTTNSLKQSYVVPVYHDGRLYGMSNRILVCLDASDGGVVWRSREPGDGFPILVGDLLVMVTKPGSIHVAPASKDGWNEVASITPFDEHSWSEPAYAGGHLYARSMARLVRIAPARTDEGDDGDGGPAIRSSFDRFLDKVARTDAGTRPGMIEHYLAQQSSFPIVDAAAGTAHFVYYGEATDVGIVGDMIGTRREDPMTREPGTKLFHYSTALEPDAAVSYGFIVDFAEPAPDPRNPRAADGLFGEVSWFSMPAWRGAEWAEGEAPAARGRLEEVEWESAAFENTTRTARVYLPAGYDASAARYPTLYVLNGTDALERGEMQRALDTLIADGSIKPTIAVFVVAAEREGGGNDLRQGDEYAAMLSTELVPTIDGRFRTDTRPEWRGVVGSGRASNVAFSVAFAHAELFGRLGAQAPTMRPGDLFGDGSEPVAGPAVLYVEWGTYHLRSPHEAWDLAEESRRLWAALREHGWRPAGGERPVGLGWFAWRDSLDDMLRALLPG